MPKKTITLVVILALIAGALLFLALRPAGKQQITQKIIPTRKIVQKTATVFFNPQNIDLSSGTATPTSSVDIFVDTGNNEISGVQLEMQYDPKALRNVALTQSTDVNAFFGPNNQPLFREVNPETGRISFAIAIQPTQPTKKGVGKLATLSFSKVFNAKGTTTVNFLEKTVVTVLGADQSALKDSIPLSVTLSE